MEMQNERYLTYYAPEELAECLASLLAPGGASLQLERLGSLPIPVGVEEMAGGTLRLTIDAVRDVEEALRQGAQFRLLGRKEDRLLRSGLLQAEGFVESQGRLVCLCPRPDLFQVLQRRDDFRAELRLGLDCEVLVEGNVGLGEWEGQLRDLSLRGCMVELPLGAAAMLAATEGPLRLEMNFPNGTTFTIEAHLRHEVCDLEQRLIRAGFRFLKTEAEEQRQLWYFFREIERELIRHAAGEHSALAPSPLFLPPPDGTPQATRRKGLRRRGEDYPTPISRRLGGIAEFLNTQILVLRTGGSIDATQLSQQAENLLLMLEQSREALLFATVCLWQEPPVVKHCLGVAVKLADLAGEALPRDMRKAILACAMVHDLGKVLLPAGLMSAGFLSSIDKRRAQAHVELLRPRLAACGWLPREIMLPVVEQANERLDGSGYPEGLSGDQLHALARMTAVVDVIDALSRQRLDRPALPIVQAQAQVLRQPARFDQRWVKRYVQHFGKHPVGSLLRYRGGELAWVLELDEEKRPGMVRLTTQDGPPRAAYLGEVLEGPALAALGEPVEALPSE